MNMESKDYKNIFSKRLKELRTERGETQQVACNEIDIHINTLKNYENGERLPNLGEFLRIKDHYGVSFEYLIGESDIKSNDISFKEINKITGLSEKSINVLSKRVQINGNRLKILNYIIENERKYQFITILELFLMCRIENKGIYNQIKESIEMIPSENLKYINRPSFLSSVFKCDIDKILYNRENDLFEKEEKK